ncbi:MAG TPA: hypothetical protein EYP04_13210 [Anaerolineae bacterium]|nr:hypothetical protein [Anaerolineae bacterium]HIQ04930.1 hypothetical protein [Anaerolineae bacterium]
MAGLFGIGTTSFASSLSPSYLDSLINAALAVQRQPLTLLQSQRDTLEVRRDVFESLKTQLTDLETQIESLTANTSSVFNNRTATSEDEDVLTATAAAGTVEQTYTLSNIVLANAHRVRSDQQTYADQALELSGSFIIGGAASRSASTVATIANTVTAFDVGTSIVSGKQELGTGTYYVEVRENGTGTGDWEFRVVDAEGNAVEVDDLNDTGTAMTSLWQDIADVIAQDPGGVFDTGRGLKITFGTDPNQYVEGYRGDATNPAAQVDYTAQGAIITVDTTDSLQSIANAINSASFAEGNEVNAAVIDNYLVLTAAHTGTTHTIAASDSSGTVLETLGVLLGDGTFKNQLQAASDASFTVDGLTVTRSSNTGLTNVINGVTLNLLDNSTTDVNLTIAADTAGMRTAIDDFLTKFNTVVDYLKSQTAVTATSTTTYTRSPLASETTYIRLRYDLISDATSRVSGMAAGAPESLAEIGITLDDNLHLVVSDSQALTDALESDRENVADLFDAVMQRLTTRIEPFTDTFDGFIEQDIESVDSALESIDDRVETLNERLSSQEEILRKQYTSLFNQLISLNQQRFGLTASYGSLNLYG